MLKFASVFTVSITRLVSGIDSKHAEPTRTRGAVAFAKQVTDVIIWLWLNATHAVGCVVALRPVMRWE